MSNDNPYSNYATDKELYEDFLTEEKTKIPLRKNRDKTR